MTRYCPLENCWRGRQQWQPTDNQAIAVVGALANNISEISINLIYTVLIDKYQRIIVFFASTFPKLKKSFGNLRQALS
jgi:hypothetical protein